MGLLAQVMGQFPCVDIHGTGSGTQSVYGTGCPSGIEVIFFKLLQQFRIFPGVLQSPDLALYNDPLSGAECTSPGKAVHFAKTALYTFVNNGIENGHGFEIPDMAMGVVVKNHTRVQDVLRVKEFFNAMHDVESIISPFQFYERGHIDARSVFCLKGTFVFLRHHGNHILHEGFVALYLSRCVKGLIQNEMKVAFQGMPVNGTVVVLVLSQNILKFGYGVGNVFQVKCHVLYQAR